MASLRPVSYILNTSVTRSNSLADNLGAVCGTCCCWPFLALVVEFVAVVEVGTEVGIAVPGAVEPGTEVGAVEVVVVAIFPTYPTPYLVYPTPYVVIETLRGRSLWCDHP